ncbi:hypothetical protein FACS18949_17580 [Clostridia bacterium]|nr:hypothetical protein FACS18949_17580 [Clostridia bacterium]
MLISLMEWAKKHERAQSTVRQLVKLGGLPQAQKIGRNYVIEESTPYPVDRRIVSGKYIKGKKEN